MFLKIDILFCIPYTTYYWEKGIARDQRTDGVRSPCSMLNLEMAMVHVSIDKKLPYHPR